MSEKTHTTALVLIPPEEIWEPIQAIRRLHDRQVRRWMPHITLVYPFRPSSEFDALAAPLAEALRGIAPFEIELSRFRRFRHGQGKFTVWLEPEPKGAVVALQEALQRVVPDCDETSRHAGGFTPHLSVGQFQGSRESLEEFLAGLGASWRPLGFAAREVSLIRRGEPPDDVFEVDRRISLGAPAP